MASAQHSGIIQSVVARLTELTGHRPRVRQDESGSTVEADVTPELTAHWQRLVEVLELGTSYGMTNTADGGYVWLRVEAGDPPAARPDGLPDDLGRS
ncbi:hypothetical protein [Streptomyces sp. NPDC051567]|uniref:hypothetical protein n=1 Tax=Streptomyces sp. NPDC051567 TaxID=3365660 RepID=UPI0037A92666